MNNNRSRSSAKKDFPLQTFTYYIPAPPHRNTGYREREFDKIMAGISNSGFEILNVNAQSVSTHDHSGLFIVVVLRPINKKAKLMDKGQDIQELFKLAHTHSSPDLILDEEDE
jgi:hypothetical protein